MIDKTRYNVRKREYDPPRRRVAMLCVAVSLMAQGCGSGSSVNSTLNQPAPQQNAGLNQGVSQQQYRLSANDKMRIIVFGEDNLSGEFVVNGNGNVDLPLIGGVKAQGANVREFQERVVAKYKNGYLKDPKVSVEVLNYRPFFITGEVKSGGEYPYKNGLTVQDAVAIAGGYTYRANTGKVMIRRAGQDKEQEVQLGQRVPIVPGDNIRIPERYF
jgi:protein involved in polysaccharide export with SLBB domain